MPLPQQFKEEIIRIPQIVARYVTLDAVVDELNLCKLHFKNVAA